MKTYQEMTLAERQAEYAALCRTHQEQKALGLELNMARPGAAGYGHGDVQHPPDCRRLHHRRH